MGGAIIQEVGNIAIGEMQIRVAPAASHIATITAALSSSDSIGGAAGTKFTNAVEFKSIVSGYPEIEAGVLPVKESFAIECAFREFSPKNFALAKGLDPFANVAATIIAGTEVTTSGTMTGDLAVDDLGGVLNGEFTVVFDSATTFRVFEATLGLLHTAAALDVEAAPTDGSSHEYFSIPADFFTGTWATDESFSFITTAYEAGTSAYADAYVGTIGLGSMAAPKFVRVEGYYEFPNKEHAIDIIITRAQVTSSIDAGFSATDETNAPLNFGAKGASSDVSGGNAVWDSMPLGRIVFREI